jgi:hypothetical protein
MVRVGLLLISFIFLAASFEYAAAWCESDCIARCNVAGGSQGAAACIQQHQCKQYAGKQCGRADGSARQPRRLQTFAQCVTVGRSRGFSNDVAENWCRQNNNGNK